MRAKAGNNGQHQASGAGYGIKSSAEDRDRVFMREWTTAQLEVPGQGISPVALSESFWRRCSELLSATVGRWLRETGMAPWRKGHPPTLVVEQIEGETFLVNAR